MKKALICAFVWALIFSNTATAQDKENKEDGWIGGANKVLAALTETAEKSSLKGDDLTEELVKTAATEAGKLDKSYAAKAFLVAVGIGLDDTDSIRTILNHKELGLPKLQVSRITQSLAQIESSTNRKKRASLIKKNNPTMLGRRDLCLYFATSMSFNELIDSPTARAVGMLVQKNEMKLDNGFSFKDIAAGLAGIRLCEEVHKIEDQKKGDNIKKKLKVISTQFQVILHLPQVRGLPDGIPDHEFERDYLPNSPKFAQIMTDINNRLAKLYPSREKLKAK